MATIRHSLQKEVFDITDERLIDILHVTKPGKKKKKISFLCATINKEKPISAYIHQIKETDKESFKKKETWPLLELQVVDGKDGNKDTPEIDLTFDRVYKWVGSSAPERNVFIQVLWKLCCRYLPKQKPQFINVPEDLLREDTTQTEGKLVMSPGENFSHLSLYDYCSDQDFASDNMYTELCTVNAEREKEMSGTKEVDEKVEREIDVHCELEEKGSLDGNMADNCTSGSSPEESSSECPVEPVIPSSECGECSKSLASKDDLHFKHQPLFSTTPNEEFLPKLFKGSCSPTCQDGNGFPLQAEDSAGQSGNQNLVKVFVLQESGDELLLNNGIEHCDELKDGAISLHNGYSEASFQSDDEVIDEYPWHFNDGQQQVDVVHFTDQESASVFLAATGMYPDSIWDYIEGVHGPYIQVDYTEEEIEALEGLDYEFDEDDEEFFDYDDLVEGYDFELDDIIDNEWDIAMVANQIFLTQRRTG